MKFSFNIFRRSKSADDGSAATEIEEMLMPGTFHSAPLKVMAPDFHPSTIYNGEAERRRLRDTTADIAKVDTDGSTSVITKTL